MKTILIILSMAVAVLLAIELYNERLSHEKTKDDLFFASMKITKMEIEADMDRQTIHNLRTGRVD